ncbi:MAG: hypothetical protein IT373_03820 [Polyangiaceae bacterium]|nr:hypothetical protein [Polyangiaceae bacterium]
MVTAGRTDEAREHEGSLAAELFAQLRAASTGLLDVLGDGVRLRIYLVDGVPVAADGGPLSTTLGRLLVEQRIIAAEAYERVMQELATAPPGERRFGAVAVDLGVLGPAELEAALALQVRHKLVHAMQWDAPRCAFTPNDGVRGMRPQYPVGVEAAIADAVRRFYDAGRTARVLGDDPGVFPLLRPGGSDPTQRLGLRASETRFLELCDGTNRLDALLSGATLDPLHARQLLTILLLTDRLALRGRRRVATLEKLRSASSHVPMPLPRRMAPTLPTGRTPAAPPVSPPRRMAATQPTGHAPRHAASPPVEPRASLPSTPDANALSGDGSWLPHAPGVAPEPPPPSTRGREAPSAASLTRQSRLAAEAAFREGTRAFNRGLLHNALDAFREARRMLPEAPEYALYEAWTEHALAAEPGAGAELAAPRQQSLERLVLLCLNQDRQMAIAHYVRGHVLLRTGAEDKALRAFKLAAQLDAGLVDARRLWNILERRARGS